MTTKTSQLVADIAGIDLSLGKVLWAARTANDITQQDFAKQLGVSKQYLSAIENGKKLVSVEQARRFAKAIGHSEKAFIQYALQDMLRKDQAPYEVNLIAIKSKKSTKDNNINK